MLNRTLFTSLLFFLLSLSAHSAVSFPFLPPAAKPDTISWVSLFLSVDAAERDFHPHQAARLRNAFGSRCDVAEASGWAEISSEDQARISFLCSLVRREVWQKSSLTSLGLMRILHPEPQVPWETLKSLDFGERTVWESRAFLTTGNHPARTLGKSLLSLESVTRLYPHFPDGHWWKYEAALNQRQQSRIASAFSDLQSAAQVSLSDNEKGQEANSARRRLDGLSYGVTPEIEYRSFLGIVGGIRIWDDRLGDEARTFAASAQVSSTETLLARVRFEDRSWLAPLALNMEFSGGWDRHGYRGAGSSSASLFRQASGNSRLGADMPLWGQLSVQAGYKIWATGNERSDGVASLIPISSTRGHGPYVGGLWDTRDSRVVPRRGQKISLELTQTSLSDARSSSLFEARARGETYFPIDRYRSWSATVAGAIYDGLNRRDLLPTWGYEELLLPGLSGERYRARAGLGVTIEFQQRLGEGFRALAFVTSVLFKDPQVVSDSAIGGGGLGIEAAYSRKTSPTFRAELGWISGEWALNSRWHVAF